MSNRVREPLTRARVLAAAVAFIDREGLDALSMRSLATKLSVEAMALYRHVPSKEAVLDGVHETILGELEAPEASAAWADYVAKYARAFRAVLRAHPNALPIFATRPAVAESSLGHVERGLKSFEDAGLGLDDAVSAFQVLVTFIVGHTMSEYSSRDGESVYEGLDSKEFPVLARAAALLEEHRVEDEFELGLSALLRGLQEIQRERPKGKRRR